VHSLESGVQHYPRHRRRDVVEAFLVLAARENVTLKMILQNPQHSEFLVVVDLLGKSVRPGVIRLLLSFLDDPLPPTTALGVLASRADPFFVRHLLRKIGREQSPLLRQNLKRLTTVAWLGAPQAILDQLDDDAQRCLVRFATSVGMPRDRAFATLDCVLKHGRPGGRCAAAEALADFSGAEANALAILALEDPDPAVQAAVIVQLRPRRISGALPRLVEMIESPHPLVRQAARKSLPEFSCKRFLAAFDVLDDDVRQSTGLLVKKVDPQTVPLVQAELRSLIRSRRLRGLVIARAIDAVAELQATVLDLLHDEDHLIRAEAAAALASAPSEASRQALEEALNDRSHTVQEAARRSLDALQDLLPARDADRRTVRSQP
jgi:HEAT repeat protein